MTHDLRFTAEKIATRIKLIRPMIQRARLPLEPFRLERLPATDAEPGTGTDGGIVAWDSYWAGQDEHFLLEGAFCIPQGWSDPALHLPLGIAGDIFTHPEALLTIEGEPFGSADRYHHTIRLDPDMADGRARRFTLRGWTGLTGWPPDPNNPARLQIRLCHAVDLDAGLEHFVARAEVALDVATHLGRGNRCRDRLLKALDSAFLALDTRYPLSDAFRASVPGAAEVSADANTGLPSLRVIVDRRASARYGINAAEILDAVAAIGGRPTGEVFRPAALSPGSRHSLMAR